jgi:hypothetical protein
MTGSRAVGLMPRSHFSLVSSRYVVEVIEGTAIWTAADGRALWNGESLNHWSNVLTSELVALFDPVEISSVDTTVRFDGSYREGPG